MWFSSKFIRYWCILSAASVPDDTAFATKVFSSSYLTCGKNTFYRGFILIIKCYPLGAQALFWNHLSVRPHSHFESTTKPHMHLYIPAFRTTNNVRPLHNIYRVYICCTWESTFLSLRSLLDPQTENYLIYKYILSYRDNHFMIVRSDDLLAYRIYHYI